MLAIIDLHVKSVSVTQWIESRFAAGRVRFLVQAQGTVFPKSVLVVPTNPRLSKEKKTVGLKIKKTFIGFGKKRKAWAVAFLVQLKAYSSYRHIFYCISLLWIPLCEYHSFNSTFFKVRNVNIRRFS